MATNLNWTNQELEDLSVEELEARIQGRIVKREPNEGASPLPTPCSACGDKATCNHSRRLRDAGFCVAFTPATAVDGQPVGELEARDKALAAKLPKLTADLRKALLGWRDVEFLSKQGCTLEEGELAAARGSVAQTRAEISGIEKERAELANTIARRRLEVARLECWRKLCNEAPEQLNALALAREEWRAAGFVLAETVGVSNSARLPICRRWNDAQRGLDVAVFNLKFRYPALQEAGDGQVWDLRLPGE